jgi:regulator of sigma E protease
MNIAISVLVSMLGLGFLILVHEFGHFVVAKIAGMRVEEFSIGFGRYIVSRRVGETIYGVSILPLGGYVRVTGMHEEEFQARVDAVKEGEEKKVTDPESRLTGHSAIPDEEIVQTPLHRRYYAKPVWQRVIFIVAGVSMNVVAAFVLLYFVGLTQGYFQTSTTLAEVVEGSPAAEAGIEPGDTMISIAGEQADDWLGVQTTIQQHAGEEIPVVVQRGGQTIEVPVTVGIDESDRGFLGIRPDVQRVEPGVIGSIPFAAERTYGMFAAIFSAIRMMVSGDAPVTGPEGLAGPVGIVSISSEAVRDGYYLVLLAFISVNLAILNMIPLLPLDGGHVLFSVLEKILGRAVSLRTFESISMVGIALFLLLAIVATSNDLGRIMSG